MEMTPLEKKKFKEFRKKHFFSYVKRLYPPGCGYILKAKSLFSKDEEDITDYDFMIDNI